MKVELATLTSPDRLEVMARQRLGLAPPEKARPSCCQGKPLRSNRNPRSLWPGCYSLIFVVSGAAPFSPGLQGEDLGAGERQHLKEWIVLLAGTLFDRAGELALSLEAQRHARPRRFKTPPR